MAFAVIEPPLPSTRSFGAAGSMLGAWGAPPDVWAQVALAACVVLAALAMAARTTAREEATPLRFLHTTRHGGRGLRTRPYLVVLSFAAAFLSLGYVEHYLRGGPRIIDATMYFLEGRALSHGDLAWSVIDPSASFRGRFLLFHEPDRLGGIFPPGYPLLLALGFSIGAPMIVGPLLAAAIVCATYLLVHELARDTAKHAAADHESWARVGALVSLVCAALRYHTADTMSHGACALAVTLGLVAILRARREAKLGHFVLAGLAVGYLACTRIPSSFPLAIVTTWIAIRCTERHRARRLAAIALGALPFVLLLLAAQHAITGDAWSPTQTEYYATSDGPPGCFRYGFGDGIGCVFEHGDFVTARLAHGYGVVAALGTTLRRLRLHLLDVTNFEPLTVVLVVLVAWWLRGAKRARIAAILVVLQIAAYAPFYFDGNYPGGGARFFADVIPIEHALSVVALAHFGSSLARRISFARLGAMLLATMLFGFAVHDAFEHVALAKRDGGRPMYEPDLVREAHQDYGILFFETDHGFDLAYDPEVSSSHGVMAARLRHDDRDRLLYDAMGHPMTTVYRFHESGEPSTVEPFIPPPPSPSGFRFEAESEWPALSQHGGWAVPVWAAGTSASNDRVLELTTHGDEASMEIELPIPPLPTPPIDDTELVVQPRVMLQGAGATATLALVLRNGETWTERARWTWSDPIRGAKMPLVLEEKRVEPGSSARLRLSIARANESEKSGGPGENPGDRRPLRVDLDKTTVRVAFGRP